MPFFLRVLPDAGASDRDAESRALIARLARADETALRDVYCAHRPGLLECARRVTSEDAAAEEVVREVFVRLPRLIRRLRPGTSLGAFLSQITIERAQRYLRAHARRRRAQAGAPPAPACVPAWRGMHGWRDVSQAIRLAERRRRIALVVIVPLVAAALGVGAWLSGSARLPLLRFRSASEPTAVATR